MADTPQAAVKSADEIGTLSKKEQKKHHMQKMTQEELDKDFDKMLEELKSVCERLRVAGTFAARAAI